MFDHSFSASALIFFIFFMEVEISSRTLILPFVPGTVHSGSATSDDCGRIFPDRLSVSSFPDRFPHYAWTAAQLPHSDFVRSRVYECFSVTCQLHF